ncbi:hypothetical protein C4B63_80g40 [Trypanosoma cruzi]|uniref:Uncharacterized protein n=1 Tax=Trypanosoma cruzi TaxID=5693 RepID=A0A2V2UV07_TRYCR|nr:hypothetical protein C4B63_80g40 [Trypanosoma cruzi]
MTELRRITATHVDWASFSCGNILAISTGRNRRRSIRDSRVLLISASGTVLTDVRLTDGIGDVMDAAADNSANLVVCCACRGSGRNQRTALVFISGSQVLTVHELPPVKKSVEAPRHSVICLRVGTQDVAVYSLGTGELFVCVRDGAEHMVHNTLWDFEDARVMRVVRGRHSLEVLALLDDGSVALVEVREDEDGFLEGCCRHHLQLSSTAVPTQAVFACGLTLWVLCDDLSLFGYWFQPPVSGEDPEPVRFFSEQLFPPEETENSVRALMAGETRTCGVHILLQTPKAVHFRTLAVRIPNGPYQLPSPATEWSNGVLLWSGYIHSFLFRQCGYELLVQSELGGSPLSMMSLRQNSSILTFGELQTRLLSHQVVRAAPLELAGLREKCELGVKELESVAANVSDLYATEKALSQLLHLQHALVATLHREREINNEVQSSQSVSMHLIKRLHIVYIHLSIYRLLCSTGFEDKLDVSLREALRLEEARHASCVCQADLRARFEQEMDLTSVSTMGTLSMWGSPDTAPVMCIDVILSQLSCSDLCSLRSVVQQMTTMVPAVALLVLYCNHAKKQQEGEQQQVEEQGATAVRYEFAQRDSVRGEFLETFCLPLTMDFWAYLSFVADHCLNPVEVGAAYGAGCPPLMDLVPGLINGLTYSGAYELVFQLTGIVLTLSSTREMDPSVAVKLLFLAYRRGNSKVLEALYRQSRGKVWGNAATHALGLAALQTESVKLLSGLIAPQTPEETVVESILRRCPNPSMSNVLLMEFYILMRRYADALKMCEKIVSCHSIDAQRVQVIASHLRSLMPNGNASYGLFRGLDGGENVLPPGPDAYHSRSSLRRELPSSIPFYSAAVSGDPLRSEEQELEEDVARTVAHISSWRHDKSPLDAFGGSVRRGVTAMKFTPTPVASLGIFHDGARSVSLPGRSLTPQQQQLPSEPSMSVRSGAEGHSTMGASSTTLPPRAVAAVSQEYEPIYCDVILKRSKKPCRRERPCKYHDNVRK